MKVIKTIEKYILKELGSTSLLVLVGLLSLFMFFDLLSIIDDLNEDQFKFRAAIFLALFELPRHAYLLLPVACLIGGLIVFTQLASNTELDVLRTAGISAYQLVFSIAKISSVFILAIYFLGEVVIPFSESKRDAVQQQINPKVISSSLPSGFWFKDQNSLINVKSIDSAHELTGISIYSIDEQGNQLISIQRADKAYYVQDDLWQLRRVVVLTMGDNAIKEDKTDVKEWRLTIDSSVIASAVVKPEEMSIQDLVTYRHYLKTTQQSLSRYSIAMWKTITYPWTVFIMLLLCVPIALSVRRGVSLGPRRFVGFLFGVAFEISNRTLVYVGLLQDWNAILVTISVGFVFFVSIMATIYKQESRASQKILG